MQITKEQLAKLTSALWLAQYFTDEQEPSNPAHADDVHTVMQAWDVLKQLEQEQS